MRLRSGFFDIVDKLLICLIAVLTLILLIYGTFYKLSVMSADTMHIYTVATDLFRYGNLDGVFFPASPFYFPDIALSLPIYGLFPDLNGFHVAFFAASFAAFLGILYKGLGFSPLQLLLVTALISIEMIKFTFDSYFYPNHHFGAFLVLLYCFVAIAARKGFFILPPLLLLTVFSDAFTLPWILMPLALYAGALFLKKARMEAFYVGVCILLGGLGHVLHVQEFSLLGETHPAMIKTSVFPQNLGEFTNNIQLFSEAAGYLLRKNAPLIFIICGMGLMLRTLFRNNTLREFSGKVAFLFLTSSLVTIAFLFFTKILIDLSNLRYAIPAIWLPLIFFFYRYPAFPAIVRRGLLLFLVICQITVLSSYVSAKHAFVQDVTARHQCVTTYLQENHVDLALGDYWNAKLYHFLAHVPVVPVDRDLNYYAFATNKNWHLEPSSNLIPKLIFINNLDEKNISATFGAPSETKRCGDTEMWLYKNGTSNPEYLQRLREQIKGA